MQSRRFPWKAVLPLWAAVSVFLIYLFWQMAISQNFDDPDDFLRLQQIRDFVAGQSWFDLTQRRMAAPDGLAMHWSRLVDIPVLLFVVPLTPLIGAHLAEVVATIGAPLLNLLALMIAIVVITRRLVGHDVATSVLACLMALSAPTVYLQIHPARIDHHGWQIAFAILAVAAMLHRKSRFSGIAAGVALALYINISIEGAPFVAAAVGIVGLLWAFGREDAERLLTMVCTLAVTSVAATALTAPSYRWTENYCDAVMPSHLLAMAVAAAGTVLAVRLGATRHAATRLVLLVLVLLVTVATFGSIAPTCLGSPFGKLDPVIDKFWYQNVTEGLPFWRQDAITAATMVAFPVMAAIGTILGVIRAKSPEMQRRWLIMLALLVVTFVTGAMVRRAAGVTHIVALPGALILIGIAIRAAEQRLPSPLGAVATAAAIMAMSPITPIFAVASMMSPPKVMAAPKGPVDPCERLCVLDRLAKRPAEPMLASIDLGPMVIARTPHSVYGTGYHRMVGPLRETILFFEGSSAQGEAFMRRKGFRHILVSPTSAEAVLFMKKAPKGMMAQLVKGPLPDWLEEDPAGSPALRVYRIRD
jgi:hypothetical protein